MIVSRHLFLQSRLNIMEAFHDTPSNSLSQLVGTTRWVNLLLNLQNQLDLEREGDKEGVINLCLLINWCHVLQANVP